MIDMNASKFLPNPIHLSQAFDSEPSSGGAPNGEITRRTFLKRTGGATAASMVAWNLASKAQAMSMITDASAKPEDWGSRILICFQDPRVYGRKIFESKMVNDDRYTYSAEDPRAWEKIPQLDCSDGMDPTRDSRTIIDWWGQGVKYLLLHWLEYKDVVLRGNYVEANSYLGSTIRSWGAVVEGRWVYRPYNGSQPPEGAIKISTDLNISSEYWVKTYYMHRVVVLASLEVAGIVTGLSPNPLVNVQPHAERYRPWLPIKYRERAEETTLKTVGYFQLSNSFGPSDGISQGGQKFTSVASIIPAKTLTGETAGVQNTQSIAYELAKDILKIGGSASVTNSFEQRYNTTVAPMISHYELDWGHMTMNSDGTRVQSSGALNLANPVEFLPLLSLMLKYQTASGYSSKYGTKVIPEEAIDQAIHTGSWIPEV